MSAEKDPWASLAETLGTSPTPEPLSPQTPPPPRPPQRQPEPKHSTPSAQRSDWGNVAADLGLASGQEPNPATSKPASPSRASEPSRVPVPPALGDRPPRVDRNDDQMNRDSDSGAPPRRLDDGIRQNDSQRLEGSQQNRPQQPRTTQQRDGADGSADRGTASADRPRRGRRGGRGRGGNRRSDTGGERPRAENSGRGTGGENERDGNNRTRDERPDFERDDRSSPPLSDERSHDRSRDRGDENANEYPPVHQQRQAENSESGGSSEDGLITKSSENLEESRDHGDRPRRRRRGRRGGRGRSTAQRERLPDGERQSGERADSGRGMDDAPPQRSPGVEGDDALPASYGAQPGVPRSQASRPSRTPRSENDRGEATGSRDSHPLSSDGRQPQRRKRVRREGDESSARPPRSSASGSRRRSTDNRRRSDSELRSSNRFSRGSHDDFTPVAGAYDEDDEGLDFLGIEEAVGELPSDRQRQRMDDDDIVAESGLHSVLDVPSWVEAIGIVIAGNLDARSRSSRSDDNEKGRSFHRDSSQRDQHRGHEPPPTARG
ncbi:MAG: hypothetical protein CK530_02360 [Planctomycetaceae bacterium]|nr:MAG: hypothetical protein CK530_12815 [Planctomycetaceae bacterium]PHY03192.1 MAG: hypothetical protein CK530_02360 [Planctomycetaceae bacterium]